MSERPEIKVYTTAELATIYGIDVLTFRKWLAKISNLGEREGNYYKPKQVEIIFNHLGTPGK